MNDDYTFIVTHQTNPEDSPYRSHVEVNDKYYLVSSITHEGYDETLVFAANTHGEITDFADLLAYYPANHTAALTYLRHCAKAHVEPEYLLETDPYDEYGDEQNWDWDFEGEDVAYEDKEL